MKHLMFTLSIFVLSLSSFAQDNVPTTIFSSTIRGGNSIGFEPRNGNTRDGEIDFISNASYGQDNYAFSLTPGDTIGFDIEVRGFNSDVTNSTDSDIPDTAKYKTNFSLQASSGISSVKVGIVIDSETEMNSSVEFTLDRDNNILTSTEFINLIENVDARILIINTGSENLNIQYFQLEFDQVISNINATLARENGAIIENPVTDGSLHITLGNGITSANLELLSLSGEVIASQTIISNGTIDVSTINPGLYILRDRNTNSTQKVIIQ